MLPGETVDTDEVQRGESRTGFVLINAVCLVRGITYKEARVRRGAELVPPPQLLSLPPGCRSFLAAPGSLQLPPGGSALRPDNHFLLPGRLLPFLISWLPPTPHRLLGFPITCEPTPRSQALQTPKCWFLTKPWLFRGYPRRPYFPASMLGRFLEISVLFVLRMLLLSCLAAVEKISIYPGLRQVLPKNSEKCNAFGSLGIHSFVHQWSCGSPEVPRQPQSVIGDGDSVSLLWRASQVSRVNGSCRTYA